MTKEIINIRIEREQTEDGYITHIYENDKLMAELESETLNEAVAETYAEIASLC